MKRMLGGNLWMLSVMVMFSLAASAQQTHGALVSIIKTFSRVFYVAPLFVLGGAPYLNGFNPQQLQALALLFLKVNDRGAAMALAFFGFGSLLNGYLVFRSSFLLTS